MLSEITSKKHFGNAETYDAKKRGVLTQLALQIFSQLRMQSADASSPYRVTFPHNKPKQSSNQPFFSAKNNLKHGTFCYAYISRLRYVVSEEMTQGCPL
jgi:hypothetical protein